MGGDPAGSRRGVPVSWAGRTPVRLMGSYPTLGYKKGQTCLTEGPAQRGRGGMLGGGCVFLTLHLSCFPSPGLPLCLLLSPGVSGGGKAQVFAKLMTCLYAKLTGGWTSTQILLMASLPLFQHPRSLAPVPCRLQPLPTPMLVALAPQSTPESLIPGLPFPIP